MKSVEKIAKKRLHTIESKIKKLLSVKAINFFVHLLWFTYDTDFFFEVRDNVRKINILRTLSDSFSFIVFGTIFFFISKKKMEIHLEN